MKHLKHLFTTLFLLCTSVATAHDFEIGGIYYNITNSTNKTVEVTYKGSYSYSYSNEYTGNVVIPESVKYNGNTYNVTSIGDYVFYGCSGLTSIVIPNSVTSIGDEAFAYCENLTSIEIPNSVTSIGEGAFYYCSGLTSIEIPNSVTSIGECAFYFCSGLTSIEIGNSVTSIGDDAFYKCSGLTAVHISDLSAWCNIDFVDYYSNPLYYAKNLYLNRESVTELVIPNDVTKIKDYAFYGCSGLETVINFSNLTFEKGSSGNGYIAYYADKVVNAPNGAIEGDFVFGKPNCVNTLVAYLGDEAGIILPESYNGENYVIAADAFRDNANITSVTIPTSVTSIGSNAFYECSGLTSIEIPNSVTSIGSDAFYGCSGLTSIEIPNSVTSIGWSAFYGTEWYNNQPDGVVYAGKVFYKYKGTMPKNTSITIKDGTLGIAGGAFYGCSGLTSIEIPNSVTSIGDYAFRGCSGLTSIEIPNSVTSIGSYAFGYCRTLTSIVIPNSVTSIGGYAFYNCSGLTSIEIPNSVTSIGNSAFEGTAWYNNQPNGVVYAGNVLYKYKGDMPSNTSIKINEGTSGIAGSAFSGCSGLTSIEIPNSVTSIGDDAFYGCINLKTVYNFSNLTFTKRSEDFGYIAYYADIVITPVNGVSPITSLAELSNSSVYYIYQHYHSKGATSWAVATDGDALKSNNDLNIAIDKNDTRQQFAILSIDGGVTRYLYHIATQMFVNLDGSLSTTPFDAINFIAGKYTNTFIAYFDNSHYVNVGGSQQMIIDKWNTPDGGNSCSIIPVGEFDSTNALEMFEGYTTEIDEMQGENEKVVYDLNGRRIVDAEYLERGVYIIDGKKVVVK